MTASCDRRGRERAKTRPAAPPRYRKATRSREPGLGEPHVEAPAAKSLNRERTGPPFHGTPLLVRPRNQRTPAGRIRRSLHRNLPQFAAVAASCGTVHASASTSAQRRGSRLARRTGIVHWVWPSRSRAREWFGPSAVPGRPAWTAAPLSPGRPSRRGFARGVDRFGDRSAVSQRSSRRHRSVSPPDGRRDR